MTHLADTLVTLRANPICGYGPPNDPRVEAATEPTALAALALLVAGHAADAEPALNWLTQIQSPDGSIGVTASQPTPCWPTALAVLAWQTARRTDHRFSRPLELPIRRAVRWQLAARGKAAPRTKALGHDTTLQGWSWVVDTHSWIEPTAFHILALKATGHHHNERVREATTLLVDRLLPDGGCNYGNTFVLGNKLRPHPGPTGLAMLALADAGTDDPRVHRTLDYLEHVAPECPTAQTLAWVLLGLAAHGRTPRSAAAWIDAAARRADRVNCPLPARALLLLAAHADQKPFNDFSASRRPS